MPLCLDRILVFPAFFGVATLSIDDKTHNLSGKTMDIFPCIPYFQLFDGEQGRFLASLVFILSSFSHLFYLGSKFRLQLRYVSWGAEER